MSFDKIYSSGSEKLTAVTDNLFLPTDLSPWLVFVLYFVRCLMQQPYTLQRSDLLSKKLSVVADRDGDKYIKCVRGLRYSKSNPKKSCGYDSLWFTVKANGLLLPSLSKTTKRFAKNLF